MASKQKSGIHRRGFASMTPERRAEVASAGGKAAHKSGNARTFSSKEAVEAGRKGGKQRAKNMRVAYGR